MRGIPVRVFNRCHSGLVPLVIPDISPPVIPNVSYAVIPDVSHPVIPDIIHRESKGRGEGVPKGAGEARPSCEAPTTGQKEKDSGFPLTDGGNDKRGEAGMTRRGGHETGLLP